jgi:hypothetical protein
MSAIACRAIADSPVLTEMAEMRAVLQNPRLLVAVIMLVMFAVLVVVSMRERLVRMLVCVWLVGARMVVFVHMVGVVCVLVRVCHRCVRVRVAVALVTVRMVGIVVRMVVGVRRPVGMRVRVAVLVRVHRSLHGFEFVGEFLENTHRAAP